MNTKEAMNVINKPISMVRDELVDDIIGAINNSGLPFYFIEPILKNLLNEVSVAAKKEKDFEKAQYEEAIKRQAEAKAKKDK